MLPLPLFMHHLPYVQIYDTPFPCDTGSVTLAERGKAANYCYPKSSVRLSVAFLYSTLLTFTVIFTQQRFDCWKPCCRKETRDAAAVVFGLKFADNIHYKFKSGQLRKPAFRATNVPAQKQNFTKNGHSRSRVWSDYGVSTKAIRE